MRDIATLGGAFFEDLIANGGCDGVFEDFVDFVLCLLFGGRFDAGCVLGFRDKLSLFG